jgi:hypothetical protein
MVEPAEETVTAQQEAPQQEEAPAELNDAQRVEKANAIKAKIAKMGTKSLKGDLQELKALSNPP